jgi:hypothetical protein
MNRYLVRLGALPQKVVWDREGAIDVRGGRPTDPFAGRCGRLAVGRVILEPGDCQPQGCARAHPPLIHGNFEPTGSSPNRSTSSSSTTSGATRSMGACTAAPARWSESGSRPSAGGCGRCRGTCPTSTGAAWRASRRSPTCASTATTTLSTRAWPAGGSRSAPPSTSFGRWRSTRASSPPATRASSPAVLSSPTPPAGPGPAARRAHACSPRDRARGPLAGPLRPADPGNEQLGARPPVRTLKGRPRGPRDTETRRQGPRGWSYERSLRPCAQPRSPPERATATIAGIKAARSRRARRGTSSTSPCRPGAQDADPAPRPARLPAPATTSSSSAARPQFTLPASPSSLVNSPTPSLATWIGAVCAGRGVT